MPVFRAVKKVCILELALFIFRFNVSILFLLKDTCRGDSGGPLMMFVERQWQLVGVTSYGPGCALEGFSGIYTRIAYYHSYIEQIINSNHTNSSTTSAANIGQSSPNVEHHSNTGSSNRILAFLIYLDFILILYTHLFRTN